MYILDIGYIIQYIHYGLQVSEFQLSGTSRNHRKPGINLDILPMVKAKEAPSTPQHLLKQPAVEEPFQDEAYDPFVPIVLVQLFQ